MGKKIYLSPSSQWANKYSYGSYTEAEICGKIAEETRIALLRNGYDVKVGSNRVPYQERVKESNAWGSELHIPIHSNAGGGDGTVVFCYPKSVNNIYVQCIYDEVAKLTPTKDDGIRPKDNLYEINNTECVCVYVECEFHDNADLAKWIVENVKQIAERIAKGVCTADGKEFKHVKEEEKEIKYTVQVGAFSVYENAKNMAEKLKKCGFECFIKDV